MPARLLIGSALASLLAATGSGVRAEEPFAATESNFDLSPLTFNALLAQAQEDPGVAGAGQGVVASESAGPSQEALAKAAQNPIASRIPRLTSIPARLVSGKPDSLGAATNISSTGGMAGVTWIAAPCSSISPQ